MTPHSPIPALAISFALLALVAWVATAHPGDGPLFAASGRIEAHAIAQPTAPALLAQRDTR